jgi:hypothetical protein
LTYLASFLLCVKLTDYTIPDAIAATSAATHEGGAESSSLFRSFRATALRRGFGVLKLAGEKKKKIEIFCCLDCQSLSLSLSLSALCCRNWCFLKTKIMGISSSVVFQMLRKQKKLMMPAAAVLPSLLLARNPVPRELGLLTTQKTVVCTSEKGYYFVQEDRASSLASKRWQISRMFLSGIAGTILISNSYPHFSQSLLLWITPPSFAILWITHTIFLNSIIHTIFFLLSQSNFSTILGIC